MAARKKTAKKKSTKKRAAKKKAARKKAGKKKASRKKKAAKASSTSAPDTEDTAKTADAAADAAADEEDLEPVKERPPVPKMPKRLGGNRISLAYGSGAECAFMVYALEHELVDTEDRRYALTRKEQLELDQEAPKAAYDTMMLSAGAYPKVLDRYMLLPCGSSYGDHRGPVLVARKPIRSGEVRDLAVATAGPYATGGYAVQMWLPQGGFRRSPMPTRQVSLMVRAQKIRAGIIQNEDQLTLKRYGLLDVVDLGHWWGDDTEGLPLPITVCGIRRDIDEEERRKIALDIKRSIAYGLGHREEAMTYTRKEVGRELPEGILEKYVDRYVNDLSLDAGERGRQALQTLYERSIDLGLMEGPIDPEYHGVE